MFPCNRQENFNQTFEMLQKGGGGCKFSHISTSSGMQSAVLSEVGMVGYVKHGCYVAEVEVATLKQTNQT